MTDENAHRNARDEAARGDESLRAACVLLDNGLYNDAISRAYYAAFHWASAVLMAKGLQAKTHRGTIQLLSLHFVKPGLLPQDAANHLAHLETSRELSDYTGKPDFTEEQVRQAIAEAERFLNACKPLLGPP